jgi:DinB superfamily
VTFEDAARDVAARLDESRAGLLDLLGDLDDDALRRAPEGGGWDAGGHVDHIERAERAFHIILRIIRVKGAIGRVFLPWSKGEIEPGPLDFSYAGTSIRSPGMLGPRGRPALAALLDRLARTRRRTARVLRRVGASTRRGATFAHPAFGRLDAVQWLAVLALHERHHTDRIKSLTSSL